MIDEQGSNIQNEMLLNRKSKFFSEAWKHKASLH